MTRPNPWSLEVDGPAVHLVGREILFGNWKGLFVLVPSDGDVGDGLYPFKIHVYRVTVLDTGEFIGEAKLGSCLYVDIVGQEGMILPGKNDGNASDERDLH